MKKPRVSRIIPTRDIEWYVGKLHVSATDDTVRAGIRERAAKINARALSALQRAPWTAARIRQAEEYAVWCHARNGALYRAAMSGSFAR